MTFRFDATTSRLRFDPVRNRRTFYISLTLGRYTIWRMRWDTGRCDGKRILLKSRDGLMCWSCGRRCLSPAA
jgi:hypothetical protein